MLSYQLRAETICTENDVLLEYLCSERSKYFAAFVSIVLTSIFHLNKAIELTRIITSLLAPYVYLNNTLTLIFGSVLTYDIFFVLKTSVINISDANKKK